MKHTCEAERERGQGRGVAQLEHPLLAGRDGVQLEGVCAPDGLQHELVDAVRAQQRAHLRLQVGRQLLREAQRRHSSELRVQTAVPGAMLLLCACLVSYNSVPVLG